jgi:hypothetical protein
MPKKPMPVGPPGKEGPSPPPPRTPDLPGGPSGPEKPMPVGPPAEEGPPPPPPRAPELPRGPSGPGSSEPQRNPPPQEGGFPVSVLVAKLITDIQTGIQAAFLQQVESTSREIEMLRALPEERLAEYLVPEEEAVAEFRRLFPPAERTETQSRISAVFRIGPLSRKKGKKKTRPSRGSPATKSNRRMFEKDASPLRERSGSWSTSG